MPGFTAESGKPGCPASASMTNTRDLIIAGELEGKGWNQKRGNSMRCMLTVVLVFLFFGTAAVSANAATLKLPRTGQTKCYSGSSAISCAGTGQDAYELGGYPWPEPRFSVGSGTEANCVTDNLTGLTWMKSPDATLRTWQEALDFAATASFCGFSDWRLPSILELESLATMGFLEQVVCPGGCNTNSEWLNTQGFVNVPEYPNEFWSSSTNSNQKNYAWVFRPYDASFTIVQKDTAGDTMAWLVRESGVPAPAPVWRTGQSTCYDVNGTLVTCSGTGQDGDLRPGIVWPNPRFSDMGNGTVADNLTGLIWLKSPGCLETIGGISTTYGTFFWSNALTWVNNLASGHCDLSDGSQAGDWRLPNRKELLSLLDFEYNNRALSNDAGTGKWSWGNAFYFDYAADSYHQWSSTTSLYGGFSLKWSVDMNYGDPGTENLGNSYLAWPVRGGKYLNLLVQKTGTGTGVVTGTPSGINCGATCSEYYLTATVVKLYPQPDPYTNVFSGWSGDADCSDGQVTIAADKNFIATFSNCGADWARIARTGSTYAGVTGAGNAYSSAINDDIIELIGYARLPISGLNFDLDKRVTLSGGRDCSYAQVPTAFTKIFSSTVTITISKGTVTFDRILIM